MVLSSLKIQQDRRPGTRQKIVLRRCRMVLSSMEIQGDRRPLNTRYYESTLGSGAIVQHISNVQTTSRVRLGSVLNYGNRVYNLSFRWWKFTFLGKNRYHSSTHWCKYRVALSLFGSTDKIQCVELW
jgi:hypothetical protein